MTFRTDIKSTLLNDTSIGGDVGGRIYWLRAPLNVQQPYIVLSVISEVRDKTLTGNVDLAQIRLQVDMFGESYTGLQSLDDSVRAALTSVSSFSALHSIATEMFEDDTLLYHLMSEFSIFHPKP